MEHNHENTPPRALPGLWRERPELRRQVWPDLLVPEAA